MRRAIELTRSDILALRYGDAIARRQLARGHCAADRRRMNALGASLKRARRDWHRRGSAFQRDLLDRRFAFANALNNERMVEQRTRRDPRCDN